MTDAKEEYQGTRTSKKNSQKYSTWILILMLLALKLLLNEGDSSNDQIDSHTALKSGCVVRETR